MDDVKPYVEYNDDDEQIVNHLMNKQKKYDRDEKKNRRINAEQKIKDTIYNSLNQEFQEFPELKAKIDPDLSKTIELLSDTTSYINEIRELNQKIKNQKNDFDEMDAHCKALEEDYNKLRIGGSKKSNKKRKHKKRGTKKRC